MEKTFTKEDLDQLETRYKVNLINSISGYKAVNLIGTINTQGITNLSIVSSVVHIGSNPALIGFVLRPTSVPRHTYENLIANNSFTINQVNKNLVGKAHYSSARFDDNESEFEALQLNEEYINNIPAPFVQSSPLKIGLTFKEEHLLSNGCRLIIGEVIHLSLSQNALLEDGSLNNIVLDSAVVSGLNKYYTSTFLSEYPYAKKQDIQEQLSPKKKERPDNVVFNNDSKKYDASLKSYNTNVGAPAIQLQDLDNWKRVGSTKVNHHLKTRYESLKKQFQETVDIYEWNQLIYSAKFSFEPITGETYHLYEDSKAELFLSPISPEEWNKKHVGSFLLDIDRIFIKV